MKEKTKYILKSIAKYAPYWTGMTLSIGGILVLVVGMGKGISSMSKLYEYRETPAVQQAVNEAKANLDNDLINGKINSETYEQKLAELKTETAKEIYKNDGDFQAILKEKENAEKITEAGILTVLPSLMLGAAGLFTYVLIDPKKEIQEYPNYAKENYEGLDRMPKTEEIFTDLRLKKFDKQFDDIDYENDEEGEK